MHLNAQLRNEVAKLSTIAGSNDYCLVVLALLRISSHAVKKEAEGEETTDLRIDGVVVWGVAGAWALTAVINNEGRSRKEGSSGKMTKRSKKGMKTAAR